MSTAPWERGGVSAVSGAVSSASSVASAPMKRSRRGVAQFPQFRSSRLLSPGLEGLVPLMTDGNGRRAARGRRRRPDLWGPPAPFHPRCAGQTILIGGSFTTYNLRSPLRGADVEEAVPVPGQVPSIPAARGRQRSPGSVGSSRVFDPRCAGQTEGRRRVRARTSPSIPAARGRRRCGRAVRPCATFDPRCAGQTVGVGGNDHTEVPSIPAARGCGADVLGAEPGRPRIPSIPAARGRRSCCGGRVGAGRPSIPAARGRHLLTRSDKIRYCR
jgi:hypothetical protein